MKLVKPLKKATDKFEEDYQKEVDIEYLMKSCPLFCLWVGALVLFVATFTYLLLNKTSNEIFNNVWWIFVIVLIFILVYIRYLKVKRFQKIAEEINRLDKTKRSAMAICSYIFFCAIPVATFITNLRKGVALPLLLKNFT